jgi:hypothetical protein
LDSAVFGTAEPKPRFLDRIVCLAARAEHTIGYRPQKRSPGLELLREEFLSVHRHILLLPSVIIVTNADRTM